MKKPSELFVVTALTMEERFDNEFPENKAYDGDILKGDLATGKITTRRKIIKSFIQEEITRAESKVVRDILKMQETAEVEDVMDACIIPVEKIEAYAKQNNL